jgi:uncharacterized protein (DUF427 family)
MIDAWNGVVVAQSSDTIRVEGYDFFPPDSIDWGALIPRTRRCG